jgi:hypothetical protein
MYPDDARLTAAQAADWFSVTAAAINGWYYRGHLTDVNEDENGDRTYRFDELLEAEAKTRHHPNSRRRPQLIEA